MSHRKSAQYYDEDDFDDYDDEDWYANDEFDDTYAAVEQVQQQKVSVSFYSDKHHPVHRALQGALNFLRVLTHCAGKSPQRTCVQRCFYTRSSPLRTASQTREWQASAWW